MSNYNTENTPQTHSAFCYVSYSSLRGTGRLSFTLPLPPNSPPTAHTYSFPLYLMKLTDQHFKDVLFLSGLHHF